MAVQPLGDRILVKPTESESKTKSGIILPDTAQEKPSKGKVVSVGKGKLLDDGKIKELEVKAGDTVLYGRYGGTEINYKGEDLLILRESEVLAIVK
ncbi:MAG: co-chaperone GroES [Candidatus Omnitrophica bacterium]|nr:co-chaperone GroES [Candidatus Omnitrophota bacterium]MDD5310939.1 co-chaperone GroES [Candidatus Omnitrophota bacterium]MDD5545787.1 co-chaperone GroES [Candidatus Omnitrophota bacterium]